VKWPKMDPSGLTLVLSNPSLKGTGSAPRFKSTPRARTLWIQVLISASPNSLEKGGWDKLAPDTSTLYSPADGAVESGSQKMSVEGAHPSALLVITVE
jgi:hypothetical protein